MYNRLIETIEKIGQLCLQGVQDLLFTMKKLVWHCFYTVPGRCGLHIVTSIALVLATRAGYDYETGLILAAWCAFLALCLLGIAVVAVVITDPLFFAEETRAFVAGLAYRFDTVLGYVLTLALAADAYVQDLHALYFWSLLLGIALDIFGRQVLPTVVYKITDRRHEARRAADQA